MFSLLKKDNAVGISKKVSHDFRMLVLEAYFVAKNIKRLSFVSETMIASPVLRGNIYTIINNVSLSEIEKIDSFVEDCRTVEMLLLRGSGKEVEIYQRQYESHVTTKDYIEVRFKNGKVEKIIFKN